MGAVRARSRQEEPPGNLVNSELCERLVRGRPEIGRCGQRQAYEQVTGLRFRLSWIRQRRTLDTRGRIRTGIWGTC